MTNLQIAVIALIKAAMSGEKYTLPSDLDWDVVLNTAKKHQIVPLIYYGAQNCGISEELPVMKQLLKLTCYCVMVGTQQTYEHERIFEAFDNEKIDYMPLKGVLLKKIYPKPEMRVMGDADILIRYEQYTDKIVPVMKKLGFNEGRVSDNELVWELPHAYIELHRRLIPSYNKDYYDYYGDGWSLAKLQNGTRYSMSDEDCFVFLFTHFAKHYRDSGIGIRHFVDIWVYLDTYKNLDEAYIGEQLKALKLFDFYINVLKTIRVWFNNEKSDSISDIISLTIFGSGAYGTADANALSNALKLSKEKNKNKSLKKEKYLSEMFPSYEYMCKRYSILKKAKALLPVFWVVRLVDAVLFRRDNIKAKRKNINFVNDEGVSDYQNSLNAVGLDFNFKE